MFEIIKFGQKTQLSNNILTKDGLQTQFFYLE